MHELIEPAEIVNHIWGDINIKVSEEDLGLENAIRVLWIDDSVAVDVGH